MPRKSPNGTVIAPAPPRTGMPSATIGKTVARSIVDMIGGANTPNHTASMADMGAACVASAGANPFTGTAASMIVYPIVPDYERYPDYGRDVDRTFGGSASPATGSRSCCTTCFSTRRGCGPAGAGSRSSRHGQ